MTDRTAAERLRDVPFDVSYLEPSRRWLTDPEIAYLTMSPPFDPERQRDWFQRLARRDDYRIHGIELDGRPIGAFGFKGIANGWAEYFGYIGEKRHWGQGIGSWMMERAVDIACSMGLTGLRLRVRHDNLRAIRLYRKYGFERTGRDGEAILMERRL